MDLLLLALVSAVLLTLLALLLFFQSRSQQKLLLSMIQELRLSNQSLLNQVRTQDPYTLLSLNAATLSSTSNLEEEYVSHSDEAEAMRLPVGVGDELTQEDYLAFGERYFPEEDRLIS